MANNPSSEVVEPAKPQEAPPPSDPKAAFVPTRNRIGDDMEAYQKAKNQMLAGKPTEVTWEPYPDPDSNPAAPATPKVEAKPVEPPSPSPVTATPESSPSPDPVEPTAAAKAPEPAQQTAPDEPSPEPAKTEAPKEEPKSEAAPEPPIEIPAIPADAGVTSLAEAETREAELRSELKAAHKDWDYEKADEIVEKLDKIAAARPVLMQREEALARQVQRVDQQVVALYPDASDENSPFGQRLLEVWQSWEQTGNPNTHQVDGIMRAANMVANELGILPASKLPKPQPKAEPAPVPVPQSSLPAAIARSNAPQSPLAAIATSGQSPTPATQKTFLEEVAARITDVDSYNSMKEQLAQKGLFSRN